MEVPAIVKNLIDERAKPGRAVKNPTAVGPEVDLRMSVRHARIGDADVVVTAPPEGQHGLVARDEPTAQRVVHEQARRRDVGHVRYTGEDEKLASAAASVS